MKKYQTYELDPVTGSLNIKTFLKELDAFILEENAKGSLEEHVLVCLNIRNFKFYNLKYGHEKGDQVLYQLSQRIYHENPEGLQGRFVSDRLVVVSKQSHINDWIQMINREFIKKYGSNGLKMKVGILPLQADFTAARACELAKLACDSIRNKSVNFCYYNDQIERKAQNTTYIISNFERALNEGWIQIYYQPIIRTLTDRLCGIEALSRWIDPKHGMISPADFILVLEENQLITRLTLFVLDQVCQEMQQIMFPTPRIVPVSINLSQMDFLNCDIFQEVEDRVQKYGIARDLLCFEVTESMLIEYPDILQQEMKRFQNAGYKIYMDDFGSGYSSLNVLRNYEFDDIKLDMIFLQHFDNRSKRMIRSAVSMVKMLNNQILVEGVETKEQYEFLKSIGCDKVQGYYFSPPVPLKSFKKLYAQEQHIESRRFKQYYDQTNTVNFLIDKPLEIIDFDGQKFRLLYSNELARETWQKMHFASMDKVFELLNVPLSPYFNESRDTLKRLHIHKTIRQKYGVHASVVSLEITLLAREGNHYLVTTEAMPIESTKTNNDINEDYILRVLYTLFDEVYLINLKTHDFQSIKPGKNYSEVVREWDKRGWKVNVNKAAKMFISMDEQMDFIKFADFDTLQERMEKSHSHILSQIFLSKGAKGAYVNKLHIIQMMPGTDMVIYSSQYVSYLQKQWIERNKEMPDPLKTAIWQTFVHSQTMNIFWKDDQRRYLGVNDQFMETCGIQDFSTIIGKTDEQMQWYVDDRQIEDEIQLLQKGTLIRQNKGKRIIHGRMQDVVIWEEPVYQADKIVGLIGIFLLADDPTKNRSDWSIFEIALHFMKGWLDQNEKFAMISIDFSNFSWAKKSYGQTVTDRMLTAMTSLLFDFLGNRALIGRVYSERFLAFMKYDRKQEIETMKLQLLDYFRNIHELAGYPATLHPIIDLYYAEDSQNIAATIAEVFVNMYNENNR
ncbi:EAL domain-containing protein [Absicoccus intestinalis]|uniref:EAL domain-containing protein n=1 Tax=Absicoccus intestinalis TaxID=2926319 RepID=A0ABU4WM37_9FIRM|nr:EAL domain-containing protein [Absicoccus sp. CLA-KB-P134]MDX8417621.1 EAL domain-containing protein [Absicoccus sp. CLA-KB-P134]